MAIIPFQWLVIWRKRIEELRVIRQEYLAYTKFTKASSAAHGIHHDKHRKKLIIVKISSDAMLVMHLRPKPWLSLNVVNQLAWATEYQTLDGENGMQKTRRRNNAFAYIRSKTFDYRQYLDYTHVEHLFSRKCFFYVHLDFCYWYRRFEKCSHD